MNGPRMKNRMCQRELFTVSEDVRHLDSTQLHKFTQAFAAWKDAATRADSIRARERIYLTVLILRHTGARLGEILTLDDRTAFDMQHSSVRLGSNGNTRNVPLPEDFCAELEKTLESPMACSLRGTFFHLDSGYLRRICYERGVECDLPKELANPRVLRNTRAVEMLRSGVPLAVVKEVLGQSSLTFAATFQQFSQEDITTIVRLAQADMRKKSSARNSFIGHVTNLVVDPVMAEVTMETRSGINIYAVITSESVRSLHLEPGTPVTATIKAPLVNVVQCTETPLGSARNRLKATILRVIQSPAIAEITGRLEDGTEVCAIVSGQTAQTMNLQPGDHAEFWFKGLSVVLNSIHP